MTLRIVAVADTHCFEHELGELPDGDLLIHTGDLLRSGSLDELVGAAQWLNGLHYPHKIVVAGNHDWCFARTLDRALALLDDVIYLQDDAVTVEGARIWGSPWQPEFCDWAFNLERGEPLRQKWSLIPLETDILVTHGPPRGIGDQVRPGLNEGCDDLLAAVRRVKPALHFFGHIHEDGGSWVEGPTRFVNATTSECERAPTVIDFDAVTGEVTPVQVPPR